MQAKYELRHAREILEPCIRIAENFKAPAPYDCLKLNECGVWPVMEHDPKFSHDSDFERWRYALELQHLPDAQEPDATPMLPNPFTGRELAAFMLEGAGALVRLEYGDWASGPNADRLSAISRGSNARRAVTEAFDAYRNAVAEVGSWDADAQAREAAARKAYQNSPQDKALSKAFDNAEAEWQAAYKAWLTAMVCCLLEHQTQAAPEVPAPTPARVPRRTAWEVARPYMVQVLKNGQFSTAKQLYRALESKAGPDSPFDAGTGSHRGSLFVREVAAPLALKTVQNRFSELRELAQTSTP